MYVVLVTDKQLGGTTAYGPFQRQPKANALAALFTNPHAADFHDPETYDVNVALLRKHEG
jgi:hypothetical protein